MKKEILAHFSGSGLMVLLPKSRGTGFSKTCIENEKSDVWLQKLRSIYPNSTDRSTTRFIGDFYFGHLLIKSPFTFDKEKRLKILEQVKPILNMNWNYEIREVDSNEFWKNHPIRPKVCKS